ncbi:hypothetical protein ACO34A_28780 (plasmid) [Rhizobium sp. ACO-34A]|nr:ABC transporter ATP-binding protein [Rhizobium sp. ACO-34A]ATN37760.1 hypothetical protein ACO34A_28780 [Rhizobium sp. ACO-34A]
MSALLTVRNFSIDMLAANGPRSIVTGLDFDVAAGETLAIIGESGSGKSVATRAMVGLAPSPPMRVTSGSALFEGQDLLTIGEAGLRRLRGSRIGMIFQEPMSALNPMMPVGAQIAETIVTHKGLSRRTAQAEAVRLLDRVRIPDAAGRARLHPAALSGGMRQRVVIAAAIACKPPLIIADEPTTALDATVQAEILSLIAELKAEVGCAVIFITHDMAVVRQTADRILVMQNGRVVESGSKDAILSAPKQEYTRTLIAASMPDMGGVAPLEKAADAPALAIRDLIVSFPARRNPLSLKRPERLYAVDGLSLDVARGETVALVGESGSGKTTIARAALGLVAPDEGRIWIGGKDVGEAGRKGRVQFIFQDPQSSLDPRFRAWQSVMEPLAIAGDRENLRERAIPLFRRVGLDATHVDRYTHELSGGQRQRLGIARALAPSPDLVIADEAVAALDATTRLQILDLFQSLQKRTGLPMLFITHDLATVSRIAHRVAVMRFGRLLEIGPTASVLSEPRHAYTRSLVAAARGEAATAPVTRGHRIGMAGAQPHWAPMLEVTPGHFIADKRESV